MLLNSTRGFPIFADNATALGTGLAGLTIVARLRKNGGAEDDVEPTITDLGDGVYWVVPDSGDRDTLGFNVWKFTAAGAVIAPAFEEVVAVDPQLARFGASSQTSVDDLQTDVDGVLGYLTTLISRVTAGAAQAWADLITMITGFGTPDAQFTAKALELAPGGLTESQGAQLNRIEASTALITGGALETAGPVTPGGKIRLIVGKDYVSSAENGLVRSISDAGGTLYAQLTNATLTASKVFGAGRAGRPNLITGTVSSVAHAAGITSITIEIPRANVPDVLQTGVDYRYQVQRITATGERVPVVSGDMELEYAYV
jgi:hypothetical protein